MLPSLHIPAPSFTFPEDDPIPTAAGSQSARADLSAGLPPILQRINTPRVPRTPQSARRPIGAAAPLSPKREPFRPPTRVVREERAKPLRLQTQRWWYPTEGVLDAADQFDSAFSGMRSMARQRLSDFASDPTSARRQREFERTLHSLSRMRYNVQPLQMGHKVRRATEPCTLPKCLSRCASPSC